MSTKLMKIENMVNAINDAHTKTGGYSKRSLGLKGLLRLIYDYDSLNDYGKIIVDNAEFQRPGTTDYKLCKISKLSSQHESVENRQWITKEWVRYCRGSNGVAERMQEAFFFMLFALMVVTVDDENKEEKLSIICDYSRMFMITDEEMKDILETIKIIYNQSSYEVLSPQYPSESYHTLREKRIEALGECVKSSRTLRELSYVYELYLGIKGEDVASERDSKSFAKFFGA